MLGLLRFRELGCAPPDGFPLQLSVMSLRARALQLAPHLEVKTAHSSGVRSLDLERKYGRFLLAGDAAGSLAVYDASPEPTRPHGNSGTGGAQVARRQMGPTVAKPIARVVKAHKYAIAAVCWYPADPGLFVSAAYDGLVRAWDADSLQAVLDFEMHGRVYAIAISPVAASHGLIAVGSEEASIRLCDLRSGAHAHVLRAHSSPVWSVAWSPTQPHTLASGSQDCRAFVWDIRRMTSCGCGTWAAARISTCTTRPSQTLPRVT
mmetsp:Transcript_10978/g.27715  ORF Transcript_10978/g.27715 Transcript_10978/m.27715 type:complete len:263 (+) Transcript_10978:51-839(+)